MLNALLTRLPERPVLRGLVSLLVIGSAVMGTTFSLRAQSAAPPPPPAITTATTPVKVDAPPHPDSVSAMLPFARAHVAMNSLRDRADAEYAEPKNKKPEVLTELRAKYSAERERMLTSQGLTEASYGLLILRVSSDDSARSAFEAALAKASAK